MNMPRLTLRFVSATLAFTVGVVLTSLWVFGRLPLLRREKLTAVQSLNEEMNFKLTLEHHRDSAYLYTYEAADGVKVERASMRFESAEAANSELRNKVNFYPNPTESLERNPKVDSNGSVVGQRVVAVETGMKSGGQLAYIVWTNGEELCWILSPSLRHALELERQGRF